MKKISVYFLLSCLSFLLINCKGSSDSSDVTEEELYEFQGFSMKSYDIPIIIMLPDETANIGASTRPEVTHIDNDFRWEINVGPNFNMIIDDWGSDRKMVESKKKELASLKFYKINYLVDEPDFILYEQELKVQGKKGVSKNVGVEHKTYHAYGQKVVNDITYVLEVETKVMKK